VRADHRRLLVAAAPASIAGRRTAARVPDAKVENVILVAAVHVRDFQLGDARRHVEGHEKVIVRRADAGSGQVQLL
jgi:hypothetical protein